MHTKYIALGVIRFLYVSKEDPGCRLILFARCTEFFEGI